MKIFDIVGRRKLWFTISICLMVLALVASFFPGVKLDIQFSGGTIMTYAFTGEVDKGAFETTVEGALGGRNVSLQEQHDVNTGLMNYVVTLSEKTGISPDDQIAVNTALTEAFPESGITMVNLSNVDPTIGRDFFAKSIVAVALAAVVMIL